MTLLEDCGLVCSNARRFGGTYCQDLDMCDYRQGMDW
jgi:hypothetical protein